MMTPNKPSRRFGPPVLLCCWLACGIAAPAAPVLSTNTPALTNQFRSVFDEKLPDGKDPFFPLSTRRSVTLKPHEESESPGIVALTLKGFSGGAGNRLAIINDHTFAVGEEREVTTVSGRIKIRCLEIEESSVVVTVGNSARREVLKLAPPGR